MRPDIVFWGNFTSPSCPAGFLTVDLPNRVAQQARKPWRGDETFASRFGRFCDYELMIRPPPFLMPLVAGCVITILQILMAVALLAPEEPVNERYSALVQHDSYWFMNIIDRGYQTIIPRRRLLGIALSYGVARIHLLEHHRGSHGESLGGYARAGYVRDANCRNCLRCLSSGALGFSNRMARVAQATQMVPRERGSCRFNVCGGLRRNRFFRFVPTALGSLGPVHAYAGGWLGHCARLPCSV